MRKLVFVMAAIGMFGLMLFPQSGEAGLTALTEDQMSDVTGQGGIYIEADDLVFDIDIETLYYYDDDGVGPGTTGGYLSLCDVALNGSIDFGSPLTLDIVTRENEYGTEVTSIDLTMTDITIKVDSFTIDAIRLGPVPGTGPSLGSIGILNMVANISGTIRISAH